MAVAELHLQGGNDDGILQVGEGPGDEVGLVLGLPALAAALGGAAGNAHLIRDQAPVSHAVLLHSQMSALDILRQCIAQQR